MTASALPWTQQTSRRHRPERVRRILGLHAAVLVNEYPAEARICHRHRHGSRLPQIARAVPHNGADRLPGVLLRPPEAVASIRIRRNRPGRAGHLLDSVFPVVRAARDPEAPQLSLATKRGSAFSFSAVIMSMRLLGIPTSYEAKGFSGRPE